MVRRQRNIGAKRICEKSDRYPQAFHFRIGHIKDNSLLLEFLAKRLQSVDLEPDVIEDCVAIATQAPT